MIEIETRIVQVVHNKTILKICQRAVQYSRIYRFRQIYRLLAPNFLRIAVMNCTGQQIGNCRRQDSIWSLWEGSESPPDSRLIVFEHHSVINFHHDIQLF